MSAPVRPAVRAPRFDGVVFRTLFVKEVRRFATPEFAVIESVQSGTPRDGEPFEVQIVDLLTLEDGLIAAKRTYRKARL